MTTTAPMTSMTAPARARRPPIATAGGPANVHRYERAASLAGGGALVLYGLARRGPLGAGLALLGGGLVYRGARGTCPLYRALGVSTAGDRAAAGPVYVESSIAVRRGPEELVAIVSDPDELSRLFPDVLRVERAGGGSYRWTVRVPKLGAVAFDANLAEEVPGEALTWRTRSGGAADASIGARVRPAPAGRGAELTLTLRYRGGAIGPHGAVGGLLARGAKGVLGEALRRVRQRAEAGEVVTVAGQPAGRRTLLGEVTP
jgi:uncharacterized membrane protein